MYTAKKLKLKKYQCQGLVQEKSVDYNMNELGPLYDLYCVIKRHKPIAFIEFSNGYLTHLRKCAKTVSNDIFKIAKKKKIKCYITSVSNTSRVATFFRKKNIKRAQLCHYLLSTNRGNTLKNHYIIGKLLGYPEKNIKIFYLKNCTVTDYVDDKRNLKDLIKLIINSSNYSNYIKHLNSITFKGI